MIVVVETPTVCEELENDTRPVRRFLNGTKLSDLGVVLIVVVGEVKYLLLRLRVSPLPSTDPKVPGTRHNDRELETQNVPRVQQDTDLLRPYPGPVLLPQVHSQRESLNPSWMEDNVLPVSRTLDQRRRRHTSRGPRTQGRESPSS